MKTVLMWLAVGMLAIGAAMGLALAWADSAEMGVAVTLAEGFFLWLTAMIVSRDGS